MLFKFIESLPQRLWSMLNNFSFTKNSKTSFERTA